MVRRLPVLQSPPADDGPARPAWQWVLIGAGFLISFWIPLFALASWLRSRLVPEQLLGAGAVPGTTGGALALLIALAPVLVPWMVASGCAALLVLRFGGARLQRRHGVYVGLVAASAVCTIAALGRSFDSAWALVASALVLTVSAAGPGWLAGKFGMRRQVRG